ncbi:MAG: SprT family zinc-dependent metalloprotease [Bacteroidota bacterium]
MSRPTEEFYPWLQLIYDHFNETLFEGELPDCMITVMRKKGTLGIFSPVRWKKNNETSTDEIGINPSYFDQYPFIEILQTMAHEMCHQWQYHFGKPSRYTYHNKEWAKKMESIGLMPSHNGKPGGEKTGQKMSDYPVANGLFVIASNQLISETSFRELWIDKLKEDIVTPIPQEVYNEIYLNSGLEPSLINVTQKPIPDLKLKEKKDKIRDLRKYKVKYTCPSCETNVWGKDQLIIYCGNCKGKLKMEPQSVLPKLN